MFPYFIYISTPIILNYWYFKVNFLRPENLSWDISSLEWSNYWYISKWIFLGSKNLFSDSSSLGSILLRDIKDSVLVKLHNLPMQTQSVEESR